MSVKTYLEVGLTYAVLLASGKTFVGQVRSTAMCDCGRFYVLFVSSSSQNGKPAGANHVRFCHCRLKSAERYVPNVPAVPRSMGTRPPV